MKVTAIQQEVKILQKGKTIAGEPLPGGYYVIATPDGTPTGARVSVWQELRKKYPKAFFMARNERATAEQPTVVAPGKQAKETSGTKK